MGVKGYEKNSYFVRALQKLCPSVFLTFKMLTWLCLCLLSKSVQMFILKCPKGQIIKIRRLSKLVCNQGEKINFINLSESNQYNLRDEPVHHSHTSLCHSYLLPCCRSRERIQVWLEKDTNLIFWGASFSVCVMTSLLLGLSSCAEPKSNTRGFLCVCHS